MRNPCWLYFVSFLLLSCSKDVFDVVELPTEHKLTSKTVSIPVDLYMPSKMLVCDDNLIIRDNTVEGVFKVFTLPDLSYSYSFGNVGQGPNELSVVDQESFIYDDKFMFVDNYVLKSKDLSDSSSLVTVEFPVVLGGKREVFNALKKQNDSLYVSNANVELASSEYRILNLKSKTEESYGVMPSWDESLNVPIEKQIAYMKSICVHPSTGRKMMFYYHYPVVRIYSSSDELEKQLCVGMDAPKSIDNSDKTIYFTEPYVTSEYVYVLWVNKTKKEVETNVESFFPEILVFDWSGNIVNRYVLDKPVITFAVKDDKIYATSFMEMNQIYEFEVLPVSTENFVSHSNGILSFDMLSDYSMPESSRRAFETFEMLERDGYKTSYYYMFSDKKVEHDISSLCISCTYSAQEEDDIQISSYLDYLKNRPQNKPKTYMELDTFESNGRVVYPIQKLLVNFNPLLNRNDSVYATEYHLKEKNAIVSVNVFSKYKDISLQKYSAEIKYIINSLSLK